MSRVRNTQSRAQAELTRQQGERKQAPVVRDNSRTAHAQLRDNRMSAKNDAKCVKNPFTAAITPLIKAAYQSLLYNKMSTTLAVN